MTYLNQSELKMLEYLRDNSPVEHHILITDVVQGGDATVDQLESRRFVDFTMTAGFFLTPAGRTALEAQSRLDAKDAEIARLRALLREAGEAMTSVVSHYRSRAEYPSVQMTDKDYQAVEQIDNTIRAMFSTLAKLDFDAALGAKEQGSDV